MKRRCDISDKVMYEKFRNNHLLSGFHKRLPNSIIRKTIITNPKPTKIDDTIRIFLRSDYKKYEKFQVILSVKLLMPSKQIENFGRQHPRHSDQGCINNPSFYSKIQIIKEQLYSKILKLRITYVNRFENIRFEYHLTKSKSMLEWKILARFDKYPEIIHSFDYKRLNHPLF